MKKCPCCSEEIQDNAIKCKCCGEWLNKDAGSQNDIVPNVDSNNTEDSSVQKIGTETLSSSGRLVCSILIALCLIVIAGFSYGISSGGYVPTIVLLIVLSFALFFIFKFKQRVSRKLFFILTMIACSSIVGALFNIPNAYQSFRKVLEVRAITRSEEKALEGKIRNLNDALGQNVSEISKFKDKAMLALDNDNVTEAEDYLNKAFSIASEYEIVSPMPKDIHKANEKLNRINLDIEDKKYIMANDMYNDAFEKFKGKFESMRKKLRKLLHNKQYYLALELVQAHLDDIVQIELDANAISKKFNISDNEYYKFKSDLEKGRLPISEIIAKMENRERRRKEMISGSIEISAVQLWNYYHRNEVDADNRFKGEKLAVAGTITDITKTFLGDIVVNLKSPNPFMEVRGYIDKAYENESANLRKGQKITLYCKGDSMILGSPVLSKCKYLTE